MPREHEATGPGDLIEWRLGGLEDRATRAEEEHKAHAEHCEIKRREIWQELLAMKKDATDKAAALKSEVAEVREKLNLATYKLAVIVGILSAIGGAGLSYAMKHLP